MLLGTLSLFALAGLSAAKRPNIVFIMTDDQDLHLNSLDYMPMVQKELISKGTYFDNHYATVAQCCPSRASLLRGQAAHNTNITDVRYPGGNYEKFLVEHLDRNHGYLPTWLKENNYNTNYLGKIMNGYTTHNFDSEGGPRDWDYADILVDPYVYSLNNVVMSRNGETPLHYREFHQSDVLRIKALHRMEYLINHHSDKPFFMGIAPTSPHVHKGDPPMPPTRYKDIYKNVTVPRGGNYNPNDTAQAGVVSWMKELPEMSEEVKARVDHHYARRLESLRGVDDIVEDVIKLLDRMGELDNTYIIYTTDNGYHLGNHRVPAGKSLPYREDTNLPFIVRGPNVPAGVRSSLPGAHLDLAPTFLEIAGATKMPEILDGRSLLGNWHSPEQDILGKCPMQDKHEIINVEFWGGAGIEGGNGHDLPYKNINRDDNSYKTLRVVGPERSYLFAAWCTGEFMLFDTNADPYELDNLAAGSAAKEPSNPNYQLIRRLNAILLATKSCAGVTCYNPWRVLQPEPERRGKLVDAGDLTISCLETALDPQYDDFFESIPWVAFSHCNKEAQLVPANEFPYWPESDVAPDFGRQFRKNVVEWEGAGGSPKERVESNSKNRGSEWQRKHATFDILMSKTKELTPAQLGRA